MIEHFFLFLAISVKSAGMSGSSEFNILRHLAEGLIGIVNQNPEHIPTLFVVGIIIVMIYNHRTTIHEVITFIFQSGIRFVTKLNLTLFGTKIFDAGLTFGIVR